MKETPITDQLVQLINTMSEDQQLILLTYLNSKEWQTRGKRKYFRKDLIPTGYPDKNITESFAIRNISIGGVFVETDQTLQIGQEISLDFKFSKLTDPVRITGKVVRCEEDGVGVQFEFQDAGLKKLLEEKLS